MTKASKLDFDAKKQRLIKKMTMKGKALPKKANKDGTIMKKIEFQNYKYYERKYESLILNVNNITFSVVLG